MLAASALVLSLALAPGLLTQGAQDGKGEGRLSKRIEFDNPDGGEPRTSIHVPGERMEVAKRSPKFGWEFEWAFPGLGRPEGLQAWRPKIRVFEQQRKEVGDVAEQVARMAIRLWDLNYRRLRHEHNRSINSGIIDFYLAFGGKPGGEQLIDEDRQEVSAQGAPKQVNTIYIYAVHTFSDPLEMAREVAHEYGHATLPAVGGFKEPEDWANGQLGERLYLKWMRDLIAAKKLFPQDAMGVTAAELDEWLKAKVDPLVDVAALNGPDMALLAKTGRRAMDSYLGLAMYAEATLPVEVFARSIKLTGSTAAFDYPKAIVLAAEEPDSYIFNVPKRFEGKPIWVPLGKAKVQGQADVLKRVGDWAVVKAGGSFRIVNRVGGGLWH